MNAAVRPTHYSKAQIALHWTIALLVAFQYLINDGIMAAWHSYAHGDAVTQAQLSGATLHVSVGLLVLALAVVRLFLRVTRGAPALPANEARPLRILATATHHTLYLLIFVVPMSGAAAWFLLAERAATVHNISKFLLMVVVALHIAGALVQTFVFRSNVMMRMLSTRS